MFGIKHCIAIECCMNGGNNLEESDRQPLEYCPECQAKLWWTCDASGAERYKQLAHFARQHALLDEAEFWERSHAALNR